jgi:hypothetical protein
LRTAVEAGRAAPRAPAPASPDAPHSPLNVPPPMLTESATGRPIVQQNAPGARERWPFPMLADSSLSNGARRGQVLFRKRDGDVTVDGGVVVVDVGADGLPGSARVHPGALRHALLRGRANGGPIEGVVAKGANRPPRGLWPARRTPARDHGPFTGGDRARRRAASGGNSPHPSADVGMSPRPWGPCRRSRPSERTTGGGASLRSSRPNPDIAPCLRVLWALRHDEGSASVSATFTPAHK